MGGLGQGPWNVGNTSWITIVCLILLFICLVILVVEGD